MKDSRSIHIRLNLSKSIQKQAWDALQNMDRAQYKSYNQVIAQAIVDYFSTSPWNARLTQANQMLIADCVRQVIDTVNQTLQRTLPNAITGYFASHLDVRTLTPPSPSEASDLPDSIAESVHEEDIDWDFLE